MPDKTVLITGSSKGLGRSLAEVFARNQFNVILHGRDALALKSAEEAVLRQGVRCEVVKGDITSARTIGRLRVIAARRNLDVLINNAGIYVNEAFRSQDPDVFRRVIEVNLIAPALLTRQVYSIFQKKRSGLIININSIAGKNGADGEAAYCASKHGLGGFTKSLQFEANRDNIRVIDIYLGAMNTAMAKGRKDPEKCIRTEEAAELIFSLCEDYPSMRIGEIDLLRRIY